VSKGAIERQGKVILSCRSRPFIHFLWLLHCLFAHSLCLVALLLLYSLTLAARLPLYSHFPYRSIASVLTLVLLSSLPSSLLSLHPLASIHTDSDRSTASRFTVLSLYRLCTHFLFSLLRLCMPSLAVLLRIYSLNSCYSRLLIYCLCAHVFLPLSLLTLLVTLVLLLTLTLLPVHCRSPLTVSGRSIASLLVLSCQCTTCLPHGVDCTYCTHCAHCVHCSRGTHSLQLRSSLQLTAAHGNNSTHGSRGTHSIYRTRCVITVLCSGSRCTQFTLLSVPCTHCIHCTRWTD
jgi:hypothetical protein